ncbi:MAG: hypothetical protein EPO27_01575 [Betaproteobacteria bacterium]|nr:MAG: hypothetical protein EPO27_01575 [Betaproteobacteria bacterium]
MIVPSLRSMFEYSSLSQGVYAFIDLFSDPEVRLAMTQQGQLGTERLGATQAAKLIGGDGFSVLHHQPNDLYGFSATLLKDNRPGGQQVLAVRGSEGSVLDYLGTSGANPDRYDANADIINVFRGVARNQVVSLLNYYNKLLTPSYEEVSFYRLVDSATVPTAGAYYEYVGTSGVRYVYLQYDHSEFGLGLVTGSIALTGHSLGGHLAMALARLFPSQVSQVVTFNASGFGIQAVEVNPFFDLLAKRLGIPSETVTNFPDERITNVYAYPGPEIITSDSLFQQPGERVGVYVEENIDSLTGLHSIGRLSDAFALYSLFERIGPVVGVENDAQTITAISTILEARTNQPSTSLEGILDSLRRLFRDSSVPTLTTTPIGNRDLLYLNLYDVWFQERIAAYAGQLSVAAMTQMESSVLSTRAQVGDAFAYRYALRELDPFAILGPDTLYTPHNANGELDLYAPLAVSRSGGMTQDWITDRAQLLPAVLAANQQDITSGLIGVAGAGASVTEFHYFLDGREQILFVEPNDRPPGVLPTQVVIFADDAGRALAGTNYLLGDRLYGGAGIDLLTGKAGEDLLQGGIGLDIYQYYASGSSANDGADTILDTDGNGVLRYTYAPSSGVVRSTVITDASVKNTDTEWHSADGKFRYELVPGAQGQSDLVVTIAADAGGSMTLKDFRDGDFGIWLNSPPPRSFADTTDTILGIDLSESLAGTPGHDLILAFAGNDTVRAGAGDDNVEGGDGADMLYGEDGGDRLFGDAGRDSVYGGAGGDELHGGIDADIVEGEAGADLLAGEEGGDVVAGGADDDEVHSGNVVPLATALLIAESETATGLKGEWVDGGEGDDTVIAGAGNDQVMGGGGADVLVGGAGDDNLVGDASRTLVHIDNWMVTRQTIVSGGATNYQLVYNADAQVADSANGAGDHIYGGGGGDWVLAGPGDDLIEAGSGDDVAFGEAGADALSGGDGNDVLIGDNPGVVPATDEGGDVLDGGAGDDQVYGNGGDDVLFGGPGRDTLIGGAGKDLYVIEKGGGEDTIFDVASGANDPEASVLVLGEGITRDAIRFRTGSLLVDLGDGDAVHVEGFDPLDPASTPVLGAIQFADGTSLSYAEVLAQGFDIDGTGENDDGHDAAHPVLIGTGVTDRIRGLGGNDLVAGLAGDDALDGDAGDDQLQGGDGNDALRGGEGADVLFGQAGDDSLSGDPGNDTLVGETGNDVYRFARGDGQDLVYEQDATAGNLDRLEFATDIAPGDIDATRDPAYSGNLLLTLRGMGDSVTLANHFLGADEQVEEIRFADGTLWTPATTPLLIRGTASADALYGTSGTDLFEGLGGNDELVGREGDDRYFIARGDGQDTIADLDATPGNTDRLIYSADILPGEIRASRSGNDLVLALAGTTDRVTVMNYLENEGATAYALERIEFPADGTLWDLDAVKTLVIAPTEGNDTILGYASDDLLPGLGGNDVIRGGGGDDTLDGGAGADSLYGEGGSDTYLFDRGSGQDMIRNLDSDPADTTDVLQFSATIAPADLLRSKSGNDLVLAVAGTADEVRLDEYFSGGTALIEQIAFADGTVWTEQTIAGFFPTTGTSGNDLLQGTGLSETISGFAGADTIRGANGDDTLDGGLGVDHLYGEWGNDLLIAGTGEPKRGGAVANYLYGGPGDDVLVSSGRRDYFYGEAGNDIYLGGAEFEWMEDTGGNNLFYGGGSNDHIWPGDQNDIVMRIYSVDGDRDYDGVRGRDVILLNKSDSGSATNLGTGSTISLGGGVLYKDLVLVAQNNALYLKWGNKQIGLDWYGDSFIPPNKAVTQLQIVIEGTRDYNAASQNPMNNRKIQVFDFLGLAAAFDAARAAGQNFSVAANLPQFRLWGSDSEAIGGAVAYQYARTGSVGALTYDQMRAVIGDAAFAVSAQPIVAAAPLAAASAAATDEIAMVQAMRIADSGDTATAAATLPSAVSTPAQAVTQGGWRLAELPDEWFAPQPIHESARSVAAAWRRIARELPAHLDNAAAWDGLPPFANGVRVTPSNAMGVRVASDTGIGLSDAAAPRLRQFEGLREGLALLA